MEHVQASWKLRRNEELANIQVQSIKESDDQQKNGLQRFHIWAVAVGALRGGLLVNNHGLVFDQYRLLVTLVASDVGVPALKWKMRPRIVIER